MSREAEDDFYDITKPIEFKSKDVDDGFQHFWLPMIFMAMPGKNTLNRTMTPMIYHISHIIWILTNMFLPFLDLYYLAYIDSNCIMH